MDRYNWTWIGIFGLLLVGIFVCSKLDNMIPCYSILGLFVVGIVLYVVGIFKDYDKPKDVREKLAQKKTSFALGSQGDNVRQPGPSADPPPYRPGIPSDDDSSIGSPVSRWPPPP
ncbi:TPA: hypothetical protein DD449_00750 [Candidatus Berkelbacteria bacterium]|uniref:Uncharacterized protein n=1 Tax=Berkelbacteria bacterium GW2011_GWE1_39_12 TaxID=1618337 RepID=A0A0G4B5Q2_9BACT|nr:MAG: hypothetical protein UT28_C0001G0936 [Berkelbacteria bacterium GW2011_GWE1_39_12]HBO60200.1 hypothetical protein [Candidatus Berkelbacteria bacterium]